MRFKSLTLDNYGCHEHLELTFTPGVNAIIGPNGCGKTTVLDALQFLITGSSGFAGVKAENVRLGAEQARGIVVFEHGDTEYTLTRAFGKKGAQLLKTPDRDITRNDEIQEFIEGIFSASVSALENNVFVRQGQIDSILFSTTTTRKKEFQKAVRLHRASEAERALGNEIARYSVTVGLPEQIQLTEESLHEAREKLEAFNAQADESKKTMAALQPFADLLDDLRKRKQDNISISRADARIADLAERLTGLVSDLEDHTRRRDGFRQMAASAKPVAEEARSQLAQHEADKRAAQAIEDLQEQLAAVDTAFSQLGEKPDADIEKLGEQISDLSSKLDVREQQLKGSYPRPKLPKEEQLEKELEEILKASINQRQGRQRASAEDSLAEKVAAAEEVLEQFRNGHCPTCGQEVLNFDPVEREEKIERAKAKLAEMQASLDEEWRVKTDELMTRKAALKAELADFEAEAHKALQASIDKITALLERAQAQRNAVLLYEKTAANLADRKQMLEGQLKTAAPAPLDEGQVEKLRKLVADYDRLSMSLVECDTTIRARVEAVEQLERDLTEARSARAELGEAADLPSEAEVEEAQGKVQLLVEETKRLRGLTQGVSATEISVENYAATLQALYERQKAEAQDAQWVQICKRAREILHVSGLPTLLMREYAKVLNRRMHHHLSIWEAPFTVSLDEDLAFMAEFAGGGVLPGYRLSGGQKVVAGISFRLAMIGTFARQVGLLVLDEPSNHLDAVNRQHHLNQVILKLKETHGDLQILIVDHEEALVGSFDNVHNLNSETNTP